MEIKYIIIHHSAVSRSKNPNQFTAINNYHKSKGWGMIGYHYLIEPNGSIKTGRAKNQIGAHCIGRNHDSLGICLTGNFDIEKPMTEQELSLRFMLVHLLKEYKNAQIKYHRDFANKTCPGKLISDNWAKNLISNNKKMKLIRKKGLRETFVILNGKNYYIRNVATFEDLQSDGYINWKDVKEVDYDIRIDGVIAG